MADTRYGGPLCIATTNVYKHQLAPHQARLSGIYICQISAIMMTTMQSEILNSVMRKKETKTTQTNQYAVPKWPTKCYHSVSVESLRLLSYRKKTQEIHKTTDPCIIKRQFILSLWISQRY